MNSVIVNIWRKLSIRTGKLRQYNFKKTKCLHLQSQTTEDFAGFMCVVLLQCKTGTRGSEFNLVKYEIINKVQINVTQTSDEIIILRAVTKSTRTLLIQTTVFDDVNRSLVYQAQ